MGANKKRFFKLTAIIICIAAISAVWLWFGEGGFVRLYQSEAERQACIARIHLLAAENESLLKQIRLLRTDPNYLESVARRKFSLIKENEVMYRFDNNSRNPGTSTGSP